MLDMPNWQEITALIAGAGLMGAAFMFATRSVVRAEIVRLNGTYIRREVADERFKSLVERLEMINDKLKEVEYYSHERTHVLANEIQRIVAATPPAPQNRL